MNHLATFNVPLDGLRQLLGLPETMRIVRCHAVPNMYVGEDGVRFVVESPDLPPLEPGEEVPLMSARYQLREDNDTYRKFLGFQVVRIVHEQPGGTIDDGLGTH